MATTKQDKWTKFTDALRTQQFGKSPKPPDNCEPLHKLEHHFYAYRNKQGTSVEVTGLETFTIAEIEHLIMVARKLGYKPQW